jgi:hypothetical protein
MSPIDISFYTICELHYITSLLPDPVPFPPALPAGGGGGSAAGIVIVLCQVTFTHVSSSCA